jgi:hypothetical protein
LHLKTEEPVSFSFCVGGGTPNSTHSTAPSILTLLLSQEGTMELYDEQGALLRNVVIETAKSEAA